MEATENNEMDGAIELLGPWNRLLWVKTNLFAGGRTGGPPLDDINTWVYDLRTPDVPQLFLEWVGDGLHDDKKNFRHTVFSKDGGREVFYLLRFGERETMAYPYAKKHAIHYLAAVLNNILQPDYELRRFRDPKLGKDGILMPLAAGEWEALIDAYGPMAIEARFSSIYESENIGKASAR